MLFGSASFLGLVALTKFGTQSWAAAPSDSSGLKPFMDVSAALTGVPSPAADLGAVIYKELLALVPDLNELVTALPDQMADGVIKAEAPQATKDVAAAIVRAWYLGIVGTDAQARVVAYEHALNYAQVSDVVVLPTYARGEPHYWAEPPVLSSMKQ
jgi:hypothetical protein